MGDTIERSFKRGQPTSTPLPKSQPERVFWITLLVSLGLHGGLLFFPLPSKQIVVLPAAADRKTVRVVQLPQRRSSQQLEVKPKVKPKVKAVKTKVRAILPQANPELQRPVSAQPVRSTPSPAATVAPTQQLQPDSQASSWDDFPHYPTNTPGCFGLQACRQTSAALSQVSSFFATALPRKQYTAALILNEAQRQVYQVRKGDQPVQFLSVMSANGNQGTVYVLSDAPQQLADLAQAKEVPVEVFAILHDLGAMDADRSTFTQSEAYYRPDGSLHPQVLTTQLLMDQAFDQLMESALKSNLQERNFTVSEALTSYGGGAVHQLTKDTLTLYVNLIPTQDGNGTLIIFWKTLPTNS